MKKQSSLELSSNCFAPMGAKQVSNLIIYIIHSIAFYVHSQPSFESRKCDVLTQHIDFPINTETVIASVSPKNRHFIMVERFACACDPESCRGQ